MKTRKQNQEMERVEFFINYRVYYGEEIVADKMLQHSVTDKEIKKVASVMESNGGYPVDMCELEKLSNKILNAIFSNELTDIISDDKDDINNYYVELDQTMPEDLLLAAEKYVKYKDVDVTFYLDVDGAELRNSLPIKISKNAFDKMREVVLSGPHDKTDFDMLKEYSPEAYKEITELIFEWAFKRCIRDYGEAKPCILKEFPYQVYENL